MEFYDSHEMRRHSPRDFFDDQLLRALEEEGFVDRAYERARSTLQADRPSVDERLPDQRLTEERSSSVARTPVARPVSSSRSQRRSIVR